MEFIENNQTVSTVVIVGMWNYGIFTPDWVKENVLSEETNFNVLYPTAPLLSLKFLVPDKYSFGINANRLEFQLLNNKAENSFDMLTSIRNILNRLIYTPVNSFGINFVFKSNGMGGQIAALGNTAKINKIIGKALAGIELTRSYDLSDKTRLNFKIYQNGEDCNFDFNYSYNVKNCEDLLNAIGDDRCIENLRNKSLSLLNSLYNNVVE